MVAPPSAVNLAQIAASAAEDKLATDIVALDVSEQFPLSDVFLLLSAPNERQVGAIVDGVEDEVRKAGLRPLRREGERDGRWVLIDFGDVVVHVQHVEERVHYQLERLWKDCPPLPLVLGEAREDPAAPGGGADAQAGRTEPGRREWPGEGSDEGGDQSIAGGGT